MCQGSFRVSDSKTERVLVVPSATLDQLGRFQGFNPNVDRYLDGLLRPELARFLPRNEVEDDPSYKQIIPYVILRCLDQVFCYTRGSSQGESRLHRLRSLGVGGHVAEADAEGRPTLDAYELALQRELDEEVDLGDQDGSRRHRVGLINDDSSAVGKVHLGVVHLIDLERPDVKPRELGLADAEFLGLAALPALRAQFETWSQVCIDSVLRC